MAMDILSALAALALEPSPESFETEADRQIWPVQVRGLTNRSEGWAVKAIGLTNRSEVLANESKGLPNRSEGFSWAGPGPGWLMGWPLKAMTSATTASCT